MNPMKLGTGLVTFAAAMAVAAVAGAAEVAPDGVEFTDDGVMASLTGQAGDPAAGAEAFKSRKLGNCLACHANKDMENELFHGDVGPSLDGVADRWSEAMWRDLESQVGEAPALASEIEASLAMPVEDIAGVVRRSPRRSGHRIFRSTYMS